MQSQPLSVYWVDLCVEARNAQNIESIHKMSNNFAIRRVDKARITLAIEEDKPQLICLDYDFPDRQNLQLLRELRCEYQDIPVIMMTTQHSESLAVWAFRTGVRNYLVKPLPVIALIEELSNLCVLTKPHGQNQRAPRRNVIPLPLLPNEFRNGAPTLRADCTAPAVCYVEGHYNEKITENDLAALCGMNVFTFSKVFRCEHGMTFREFLILHRIETAKELLRNPAMTATDVAGLTGFSDASSFARHFRRYVGQTPSIYRRQAHPIKPDASPRIHKADASSQRGLGSQFPLL